MTDRIELYRSDYEALKDLPPETYKAVWNAVFLKFFDDIDISGSLTSEEKGIYILLCFNISNRKG